MTTSHRVSRFSRALGLVLGVLPLLAADGCGGGTARVDLQERFDADRAWKHLVKQVEFGPRSAGTPALERTRAWLETELRAVGLEPQREAFEVSTPIGPTAFANIFADLPGKAKEGAAPPPFVILCAHFDTKRFEGPGAPPLGTFVGANDGASGTAVVLELARVLKESAPHDRGYRFLFLDGEESLRWTWQDPDNTYGARHHAKRLVDSGERERVEAVVLLDMVGDSQLKLLQETSSDHALLKTFFDAAKELGLGPYVNGPARQIEDDHIRFIEIGLRAVDLIDFSYGPANAHWHSANDTLANCSKASLGVTGRIVLRGLQRLGKK